MVNLRMNLLLACEDGLLYLQSLKRPFIGFIMGSFRPNSPSWREPPQTMKIFLLIRAMQGLLFFRGGGGGSGATSSLVDGAPPPSAPPPPPLASESCRVEG